MDADDEAGVVAQAADQSASTDRRYLKNACLCRVLLYREKVQRGKQLIIETEQWSRQPLRVIDLFQVSVCCSDCGVFWEDHLMKSARRVTIAFSGGFR